MVIVSYSYSYASSSTSLDVRPSVHPSVITVCLLSSPLLTFSKEKERGGGGIQDEPPLQATPPTNATFN